MKIETLPAAQGDYNAIEVKTKHGTVIVEGPVPSEEIANLHFHEDLKAFRVPEQQHKAIIEIAKLPEGRLIIVRDETTIVGYATFLHPDPLERWSKGNMENLIELGAIEVIPKFRVATSWFIISSISKMIPLLVHKTVHKAKLIKLLNGLWVDTFSNPRHQAVGRM